MSVIDTTGTAWMRDAECAQIGPEMFVRDEPGSSPRAAKRICGSCDVKDECLAWVQALEAVEGPQDGVWGGTTERERRAMRTAAA